MQQTVWITGASSGIGKELALGYAEEGHNVVLSARNKEALQEVAEICRKKGVSVTVLPLDLARSSDFPNLVKTLRATVDKVDILINNGGTSQRTLIEETPLDLDRKVMEINYFGTIALTKAVLPWMIEKGGGHMAVISSISGKFGFPLRASYSASKHAVIGFFETLGLEQMKNNIGTTVICPGRIQTNISKNALNANGEVSGSMDPGIASGMPADLCARKIIKAIKKGKREVWIGRKELLLVYIHKYLPRLFWKIAPNIDPR